MRIAPITAQWPALQEFYQKLAQELHVQGVNSLITGGIACVFYKLYQNTKDCDIIIPPHKTANVATILSQTTFQGKPCHLTLKYGAPLAIKWLNGGWSAHTFFGEPEIPLARVDIFGKPPRVRQLFADENPLYLSRTGVAQMKKTRREKDWAYANLLGSQMLVRGNVDGLLHITDIERLVKVAQHTTISPELIKERPLLKLALSSDPDLKRYLMAEKAFWTRLDELRLTAYETAWKPYGEAIQKHPEFLRLRFSSQNERMVKIASQTLDPAPLQEPKWTNMVAQAKEETTDIFQNLDCELLPTPSAFFDQEPEASTPRPTDPE